MTRMGSGDLEMGYYLTVEQEEENADAVCEFHRLPPVSNGGSTFFVRQCWELLFNDVVTITALRFELGAFQ